MKLAVWVALCILVSAFSGGCIPKEENTETKKWETVSHAEESAIDENASDADQKGQEE